MLHTIGFSLHAAVLAVLVATAAEPLWAQQPRSALRITRRQDPSYYEAAPQPAEASNEENGYGQPAWWMYPHDGNWHAGYRHTTWGQPLPLVVPPTAAWQTVWGRDVGATQVVPINAQYSGPYYAYPTGTGQYFYPQPYWPVDTRQLGVYYIRGPW
jgi:hypothetical protein